MGALLFSFPQDTEINRGRKALYILLWVFFNCDKLIIEQLSSWWFVVITLFLCMFVIMEILKGMLWFVQNSDNCKSVLKDPHLCLILSICLKEKGWGGRSNQSTLPCLELIYLLLASAWLKHQSCCFGVWCVWEGDGIFLLFASFLLLFLSLNPPNQACC